jgi:HEAT repeat protein
MSFSSDLSPELRGKTPPELMRWFADPDGANDLEPEDREILLEEAAVHLAERGGAGIDFLLASTRAADDLQMRAILLGLSFTGENIAAPKKAEVHKAVIGFLHDARPMIAAGAVEALNHLGCREARAEILTLLKHSSPDVVGSVLRFMAHLFPKEAVPLLEEALDSPEPLLRENAIDELDELGYTPALPKIKTLLKDRNKDVRQAARAAVKNLEEPG